MTGEADTRGELLSLRFHWGSAYMVLCPGTGTWVAYRRDDDQGVLTAPGPDALLEAIRTDYLASPVPRRPRQPQRRRS